MNGTTIAAALFAAHSGFESETLADRAANGLATSVWILVGYMLLAMVAMVAFVSLLAWVLIYAERKVAAHFQCRLGPMRVGWHGILQTVADTIKLLFKEDVVPDRADRLLHILGPFLTMLATFLVLLAIPLSPVLQVADLNIGIIYVSAVSGLGALGILLGGWASNNKWSLLGAMRSGAQVISYEISATLAVLAVVLFSGTLSLAKIVESQAEGWWIWRAHGVGLVAFVLYLIASTAEINRTPFDLAEGESELTAGFHTEYSGMRFAMYFLAEFINMFIVSALVAILFFGGWMPFHIGDWAAFNGVMDLIPPVVWFALKSASVIFVLMWFRWTFPRRSTHAAGMENTAADRICESDCGLGRGLHQLLFLSFPFIEVTHLMEQCPIDPSEILVAPRPEERGFVRGIFKGLLALLGGMKITLGYFLRPSTVITQQYPENRATLKMFERARIQLIMNRDANGFHNCNACRTCEAACPNSSIFVTPQKNARTGKKEVQYYTWRMDACTFCNACVMVCPTEALAMSDTFESSVYDRRLLVFNLNHYAGPTAKEMAKIESPEERAKQMVAVHPYDGPVALMGRDIAGMHNDDLKALAKEREERAGVPTLAGAAAASVYPIDKRRLKPGLQQEEPKS